MTTGTTPPTRARTRTANGGFVDISDIEGKAAVIAWPLNRITALDNYPDVFRDVPEPAGRVAAEPCPKPPRSARTALPQPGARLLAGVDEVGRGALAGPVSVGIAVVDLHQQKLLADVRDSKLLKAADRERLVPLVRRWSVASAVGHASAHEIDALGIIAALRLAGTRAWLDGPGRRRGPGRGAAGRQPQLALARCPAVPVRRRPRGARLRRAGAHLVKADMQCLSVAAASILAKVERDGMMRELHPEYPAFGWDITRATPPPPTRRCSVLPDPRRTTG